MALILERLQRELNAATSAVDRGEIVAQQAAYRARIGHFDEAKGLILELRKLFGDGHSGPVTVWIMLAEALVHHYGELNPQALDRIVRAQFLSGLMRHRLLSALTAAWRAEIEFEASKFKESFVSIESALSIAEATDHAALSRVYNIACKIAFLTGDRAIAQRCFVNGRSHALKEGDQASIEAFQYNRAAFRLSRLRSEICLGNDTTSELREVRTEIVSAKSLQYLTQIKALSTYIELAEARLLMLERRFGEAAEMLSKLKNSGPFPRGTLSDGVLDLEICYCLAQAGDMEKSLRLYSISQPIAVATLDPDETLAIRWMQRDLSKADEKYHSEWFDADAKFQESVYGYEEMIKTLETDLKRISTSLDFLEN